MIADYIASQREAIKHTIANKSSVLAVSCGDGAKTYVISQYVKRSVGVDPGKKLIQFAKCKYPANNLCSILWHNKQPKTQPANPRSACMNVVTALRVFLIAMLLFAANSYADTLSDRTITSFISSLDELNSMEAEFAALTKDLDGSADKGEEPTLPDFEHVISGAVEDMQGHPAYKKLTEVVKRHGFSNAEQWTRAGDRIFHAWMGLEMDTQGTEIGQEIKNALAELDNNPGLSPEQKEQMKAMMGGAMSAMQQASSAPKADMNAVQPHVNALRAATGSETD